MGEVFLLCLFLLPLIVWGLLNYYSLRDSKTHNPSFARAIGWLLENNFGSLYLKTLNNLMDKISDLIGDRRKFNLSYFPCYEKNKFCFLFEMNPFTLESYEKCLRLALVYPLFSFLVIWALGGSGDIGEISVVDERLPDEKRWLMIIVIFSILIGGVWLIYKLSAIRQWLFLNIFFILIGIVMSGVSVASILLGWLFGLFFFFTWFVPMYVAGLLISLLFVNYSLKQAHNDMYKMTFITSSIFSAILTIFIIAYLVKIISYAGEDVVNTALLSGDYSSFDVFDEKVKQSITIFLVIAAAGSSILTAATNSVYIYNMFLSIIIGVSIGSLYENFFGSDIADAVLILGIAGAINGMVLILIKKISTVLGGERGKFHLVMFFNIFVLLVLLSSNRSPWFGLSSGESFDIFISLFLLLLPLLNAPLDWLSLGVTRGLLQLVRGGQYSGRMILAWAIIDLFMALLFLFSITAILVGGSALANAITGEEFIPIGSILNNIDDDTRSIDHWWIYIMLFSTLFPTLVHFALIGGGITLWLPRRTRLWLADGLKRDYHKIFLAWSYLTFIPVIGFVLVPGALLYFLWWLLNMHGGWLGMRLLDWAEMLAHFANPAMQ